MTNDDWLKTELSRDVVIRDEGFTDRVLAALPPPRRTPSGHTRAAVLLGAAGIATATGLFAFDGASFLNELARTDLSGLMTDARSTAMGVMLLAAVVVTSIAVAREP